MTIKDHDGLISLGASPTPANNIVIKTPDSPDGKLEIYRGVPGDLGAKLFSFDEADTDFNTKTKAAVNASGDAPIYACRAWVNLDGIATPPTIRGSGNVSSVTRMATGSYTCNFMSNMPDANYTCLGVASSEGGPYILGAEQAGKSVSSVTVSVGVPTGGNVNVSSVNIAVFR